MRKIGVEQIKVLSDPNRLAILSLLSMREMTTSQVSQLLEQSIQNTQYHIKRLLEAQLISHTRSEMVGNLMEKYYRSAFEPGLISFVTDEEDVEIGERLNLVFAALGSIKGILNHGITNLDEKRESYFMKVGARPKYPFGANYIILPNNKESFEEAERLIVELDEKLKNLADKYPEDEKAKYAVMYAVFPYE
ncbi:MAG TPA: helix-turn-helix domain-containing protein [Methanomassiliicoccales archaeon]|nr:helix-turn-helix domain-containing protein [Methanomassiliicoccales archaeon]